MNVMNYIKSNKITVGLIGAILVVLIGGFFVFQKLTASKTVEAPLQEVDLPFDPEGPYAILEPRRDGNALILHINRVSSYDAISYEITYQSDGIDRGVQGTLDTKNKKNEYTQEILFGTCSKGDTFSTLHCVFDKGVENGTLTLRIQKDRIAYKMNTTWHLQKPDVSLGVITSADNHLTYKTTASRAELSNVGFTIVNDLSGAPKLPEGKKVLGKVYAFNIPIAKTFPKGDVTIELAETPPTNAKIARFDEKDNKWVDLDTKNNQGKLTASSENQGVLAVLIDSK